MLFLALAGCMSIGAAQSQPSDATLGYDLLSRGLTPQQWVVGAKAIVESDSGLFSRHLLPPDDYIPPGEFLRNTTNPTVTSLLLKHIDTLRQQSPHEEDSAVSDLACALAIWDGKAHLPELQSISNYLCENLANAKADSTYAIAINLLQRRVELGDNQAVRDYANNILNSPRINHHNASFLSIIWSFPRNEAVIELSKQVFATGGANSWAPTLQRKQGLGYGIIFTKLLGLDSYRKAVIEGLTDSKEYDSGPLVDIAASLASLNITCQFDGLPTQPVILRNCDIYATAISDIKGAPPFRVEWSEEKKNQAIGQIIAFLQQYGNALQYYPNIAYYQPSIEFPGLDHPATPADVRSGNALFTLANLHAPTRVLPLAQLPVHAVVKQEPVEVWQAEAFLDNAGVWHSIYGYVGENGMGQAQESQLASPIFEGYWRIDRHFEGDLIGLGSNTYLVKRSVPIRLVARNLTPNCLPLPAGLIPTNQPGQKIPVAMAVYYAPPDAPISSNISVWSNVPMNPPPPLPPPTAGPAPVITVDGKGEYTFASFDLGTLYDLSRPGKYVVTVGSPAPGTESSATYSFQVLR
jgi:hypothetical protein